MKTLLLLVLVGLSVALGCARVSVQAPKEPIKVDISMRLDIYQHIKNDIDDIENIVNGTSDNVKGKGSRNFLSFFVSEAYADEGLSPAVEEAALRRKDRRDALVKLQSQGIIGENKSGLIELRKVGVNSGFPLNDENSDRMIIYQAIAAKNGSSVQDVQKLYAKRLQSDAVAGTPIEVLDQSTGSYQWKIKN